MKCPRCGAETMKVKNKNLYGSGKGSTYFCRGRTCKWEMRGFTRKKTKN